MVMSLPEGTLELGTQVAGHYHQANTIGILKHTDGSILKPFYEDERGKRENSFYSKVFGHDADETEILLRTFVPRFLGVFQTYYNAKEVSFIKLEDMTKNFKCPCILDVKICPRGNHRNIGFRIVGSRVYIKEQNDYIYKKKDHYKFLDSYKSVSEALENFFVASHNKVQLIDMVLKKLEAISSWFKNQQLYSFHSSSLLLVYEGCRNFHGDNLNSKCELKMIDFAHVFPSSIGDSNYIIGLQNFIQCIQMTVQKYSS